MSRLRRRPVDKGPRPPNDRAERREIICIVGGGRPYSDDCGQWNATLPENRVQGTESNRRRVCINCLRLLIVEIGEIGN